MKIKQTLLAISLAITSLVGVVSFAPIATADCQTGGEPIRTSIISGSICDGKNNSSNVKENSIWKILIWVLNIMLAGIGVLAVAGVVYAAVLYTSAGDSAEQVKKAKGIIMNVVIGLIAFGLMYSVLNFLIPGGIFN